MVRATPEPVADWISCLTAAMLPRIMGETMPAAPVKPLDAHPVQVIVCKARLPKGAAGVLGFGPAVVEPAPMVDPKLYCRAEIARLESPGSRGSGQARRTENVIQLTRCTGGWLPSQSAIEMGRDRRLGCIVTSTLRPGRGI